MKTVQEIIETLGGLARLKDHPIKLVVDGYMPLCIEWVGDGPRGLPLISVAMYYEQNGDLMRDPDLVMEWHVATGRWFPVSFRNDGLGVDQEAVWVADGKVMHRPKLVKDLTSFQRQWSHDLAIQGFLIEAKRRTA